MRYSLLVELEAKDGALLRVLALVERRGFTLLDVDTNGAAHDGDAPVSAPASVHLVVGGTSSIDVLIRQLQRLIDVRDARITTATHESQ